MSDIRVVKWYLRHGGEEWVNPCKATSLSEALQEIHDAMETRKDYEYFRGVYIEFENPHG